MKTVCCNCGTEITGAANFDSSLPAAFKNTPSITWARCDFCIELARIISRQKFGFQEMFVEVTRVLSNYPYLPKRSHPLDVIYREFDLMIQRLAAKNHELREARSMGTSEQRQAVLNAALEAAKVLDLESLREVFAAMSMVSASWATRAVLANLGQEAERLLSRKSK